MAKKKSRKSHAAQNRERLLSEAQQIAKGIREEGQTKEQTRAVARGIAKGIELYKKQQKARARAEAKARAKRDAAQLRAAEAATKTVEDAGRRRAPPAFAWAGWLVLAMLAVAVVADLVAARRLVAQLLDESNSMPSSIANILPDTTPLGRLKRGFLLDVSVLCGNGRLLYELAGLTLEGRKVLTSPEQTQALAADCTATTRD